MFGISIVTGPGRRRRLVGFVGELALRVGGDRQLAALLFRRLARAGRLHGARQQAGVLARASQPPARRRRRCLSALLPLTRFFGIAPSGFGIWICFSTTPRIVLRSSPSARLARNASSRFGPTMPFVSARASVWQEPHLATNACLPTIRLALSPPLTAQPAVASSDDATSATSAARARRSVARRAAAKPRLRALESVGARS